MTRTCDFCDRDALKIEIEARAIECRQLRQTIEDIKPHTLYQSVDALRAEFNALREAAGKAMNHHNKAECICVYCADLRALLNKETPK